MKTGIAICAFILAAVVGLSLLDLRERVDEPTEATSELSLRATVLPEGLPQLFVPPPEDAPDVSFSQLLTTTLQAEDSVASGTDEEVEASADAICDALVAMVSGGRFEKGFYDALVPPGELISDELRRLFREVSRSVDHRFARLMEASAYDAADQLARAHFELGRRVLLRNVRLRVRQHGLGMMRAGLSQARQVAQALAEDDAAPPTRLDAVGAELDAWDTALATFESHWREKLDLITSARPNVADLIRIAEHDRDRTIRVFATHQLGYARFEVDAPGNQRMIALAIERAGGSDDPLIRQAARFARGMSREQFYAQTP